MELVEKDPRDEVENVSMTCIYESYICHFNTVVVNPTLQVRSCQIVYASKSLYLLFLTQHQVIT